MIKVSGKILFLIVLSFLFSEVQAEEVVGADYRDGLVEGVEEEVNVPVPTPAPPTRPVPRPPQPDRNWQGGQPTADFSRVNQAMTKAPIWPKFANLFPQCAPGCAPIVLGTKAGRSNRSCHPSGNAIDVGGFHCNGKKYGPYSQRFIDFVACAKTKSYQGRRWRTLFRETGVNRSGTKDCRGSNRNITLCHWDHVHMSLGCAAASI